MADKNWQQVREIFDAALDQNPEERQKFVREACGDNQTLLEEVESLFASADSLEKFMEESAIANVASILEDKFPKLEAGKLFGHYEIIEQIGAGGMGEVYLSEDKKLDRKVALKIFSPEFAKDKGRMSRFVREAKSASSLNHPNIITIYEIGETDGIHYIAAEHIQGETLRKLLKSENLSLKSTLEISIQIASALQAAHGAGIIHRDIKPENVMIRPDGLVKLLDFGIAKMSVPPALLSGSSELETALKTTSEGMIIGTANYMSPEQAQGKDIDQRTDIFSFGIVLYEMLTGKMPFAGDNMMEVIIAILQKDPPPINQLMPDSPSEINEIVHKMLRKDRDERYQTAQDIVFELKTFSRQIELEGEMELSGPPNRLQKMHSGSSESHQTDENKEKETNELQETKLLTDPTRSNHEAKKQLTKFKLASLAMIGILILGGLSYFGFNYLKPKSLINTAFKNTTVEKLQISGKLHSIAISPDEKYLAYVKGELKGKMKLFLRHLATGSEKEIQTTENSELSLNGFSPDGNYFYFISVGGNGELYGVLYQVPILGGEPQKMVDDIDSDPSFFPNGKEFLFWRHVFEPSERDTFVVFNIESGEEKIIYSKNGDGIRNPQVSPDGEKIAFITRENLINQLAWIPTAGGEPQFIGSGQWLITTLQTRWLKDGSGLVVVGRNAEDENTKLSLVNFPTGEVSDLNKDANNYKKFAVSADNRTIAAIQSSTTKGIWEFDVAAKTSKQIRENITGPTTEILGGWGPAITNNGQVLYTKSDGKGSVDLWSINSDGTNDRLLLSLGKKIRLSYNSVWGDGIYFNINRKLWKVDLDGMNSRPLFGNAETWEWLTGMTPDSKTLVVLQHGINSSSTSLNKLDLQTGKITPLIENKRVYVHYATMSPDGKKIVYLYDSLDDEKVKLVLVDFDGSKLSNPQIIQNYPPFEFIKFTPDSKNLILLKSENPADLWQMNLDGGQLKKITDFNLEIIFDFNMSPDGKKIYLMRGNTTDEVVLIKNVE